MIRTSIFIKVEAEGRDIETKAKLKVGLTSHIETDKLDTDGIRGSDIAKEMLTLASLISQKINIDYDTLTTSKTNSTEPKRTKKVEKLIDDELADALEGTIVVMAENVEEARAKGKSSLFANRLRKK